MKQILITLFAMTVALMSWEGQAADANLIKKEQGPIPQQSIRLRIIANSDSIQDQWLKREVRDEIIKQMNTWVTTIDDYEHAVDLVEAKLPELEDLVEHTIQDRGFAYTAQVDFGQVPFPTKQYGSYIYPAGEYQALRIRIGEAKGQNWWCVLFPPLCFIDMSNGDAVQRVNGKENSKVQTPALTQDTEKEVPEMDADHSRFLLWKEKRMDSVSKPVEKIVDKPVTEPESDQVTVTVQPTAPPVEVRFFLLDRLAAWF